MQFYILVSFVNFKFGNDTAVINIAWQNLKMNFPCSRKGERRWFLGIQIAFLVSFTVLIITPTAGGPVETEFFGADENRLKETPKYLKICHKNDERLNECIKTSLEKFMENVSSGFEYLNLPNLDLIELPLLEFQLGSGNVVLNITFMDFRIYGFKDFKVTNVKSNLADSKFEISVENPAITMRAQYSAEGGVYTFPISGKGDFFLKLTDVSAVLIFHLATIDTLPELSFFTVENCIIDLLPSDIKAHFGENIDGNNAIGAAFNMYFNNNAHEIFSLIKPELSKTLAKIFGSIANEILSRHPADVLLPE